MKNGYFGIGIYKPKTSQNIGTLWRSAFNFGASFIFTVGARSSYEQPSDTVSSYKKIPFYVYPDLDSFHLPNSCMLIGLEQSNISKALSTFEHPKQACYILGAEDKGLPEELIPYCTGGIVHIDTPLSLNVAVAGSIVMYDRQIKTNGSSR
jgi:tRNA G18 (ribose-2'-O)-methylase SpoU